MARLYITEQNAILRKTSDRLIVEKDQEVLMEVPCLKLEAVLIFGNVQFTTQAAVELLQHGIELAIFSMNGRLWGQLTPPKARNVLLRIKQYELERSEDFCLRLARSFVQGKVRNAVAVLRRFRTNNPRRSPSRRSMGSSRSWRGSTAALPWMPCAASKAMRRRPTSKPWPP